MTNNVSNHVGLKKIMKCGEYATCTEYYNADNITVKFEDGIVRKNVNFSNFLRGGIGKISKKEIGKKYLGKTLKMNCGEYATCTNYNNANDITVRFDDGTVRKHININNFLKGVVAKMPREIPKNPNEKYIGKKVKMSCGEYATCIEYNNCGDITIRFDDGTIREHVRANAFSKGEVSKKAITPRASDPKEKYIGMTVKTTSGELATCIDYINAKDITVRFEDGTIREHVRTGEFTKGEFAKIPAVPKPDDFTYEGMRLKMNCGENATCVKYINAKDITVQFEDGTTREHVSVGNFLKGAVSKIRALNNQELKEKYEGMHVKMKCGENATCIKYISSTNITIQFEDGTIREHVRTGEFIKGVVAKIASEMDKGLKPSERMNKEAKEKYLGMRVKTTCGEYATCIEYFDAKNITIRFEDGTIREHVIARNFLNGTVLKTLDRKESNGKLRTKYEGMRVKMNCGEYATCIKYINSKDITVQFEDGTIREHVAAGNFSKGDVGKVQQLSSQDVANKYLGKKVLMSCGEYATCIEYFSSTNITIEFEDGTVRKNVVTSCFLMGEVSKYPGIFNRQIKARKKILNVTLPMKNGENATCIEYFNANNITIRFEDGTIRRNVVLKNFKKGVVKKVKPVDNDLETWCKKHDKMYLLEEWDYERNSKTPSEITYGSEKPVHWICSVCGESFVKSAKRRTKGENCPKCSRKNTSIPEKIVAFYLKKVFGDVCENYKMEELKGKEVDVCIPSKKIAFEYDGEAWHNYEKNIARDKKKSEILKKLGYQLIRIREKRAIPLNNDDIIIECTPDCSRTYEYMKEPLQKMFAILGINDVDINIPRDLHDIYLLQKRHYRENSLLKKYPDVAKYWDYEKNKGLTPENVSPCSGKMIFWKCPDCGCEWEQCARELIYRKIICPKCREDNTKNKYLGKKILMNCGEYATCIEYIDNKNVTVQFEDGTIRENILPSNFITGNVPKIPPLKPEEMKEKYEGMRLKMNDGEYATCIKYIGSQDITLRFDDGTIREHARVETFLKGQVSKLLNLKHKEAKQKCEGVRLKMNSGEYATCTKYFDANNVTVQFDDGAIRENVAAKCFLDGAVAKIHLLSNEESREKYEGMRLKMNSGEYATCVKYINASDITIQFDDGTIREHVSSDVFSKGQVPKMPRHKKAKEKCLGVRVKTTCGEYAECIEYINSKDITIRFDDGTIRKHVKAENFLKGTVFKKAKEEFFKDKYEGKILTMKCGMKAKCIKYFDSQNIDIEFEDGTIREHVSLTDFLHGTVLIIKRNTASENKNKYEGMTLKMHNGEYATCIKYISSQNITVRFDNGIIREHVKVYSFLKGAVDKTPREVSQNPKEKYLGMKLKMKCGEDATCIEYINFDDITVQFDDGTIREHVSVGNFVVGRVGKEQKLSSQDAANKYIGKKILMNCGEYATCIKYINANDITLQFEDGTIREHATTTWFLKGKIAKTPRGNIKEATEKHYIENIFASQPLEA